MRTPSLTCPWWTWNDLCWEGAEAGEVHNRGASHAFRLAWLDIARVPSLTSGPTFRFLWLEMALSDWPFGGLFSIHTSFISCSEYNIPRKNANVAAVDFPRRLPPSLFQGLQIEDKSELKNVTKVWTALVEDYSKRALSDERDRLPALAGLAGEIQKATKYGFVSGVWTHGLIRQLG